MKKILLIVVFLVILSSVNFATEVQVSVKVNNEYLKTSEPNLLIDGHTYLIAKDLVLALEGEIIWHPDKRMVSIIQNNNKLEFYLDSNITFLNNVELELEANPFIRKDRTYIPLRFVADYFGYDVNWIQETYNVELNKEAFKLSDKYVDKTHYTDEDLYWLSKIVQVESSDGSMEMKLAIANVVLNRVKSALFPNSIKNVIFEVDVHVQFPPAHKDSFKIVEPSINTLIASKNALEGENNIENCLFFNNSPFKSKSNDLFKIIQGEYFYK